MGGGLTMFLVKVAAVLTKVALVLTFTLKLSNLSNRPNLKLQKIFDQGYFRAIRRLVYRFWGRVIWALKLKVCIHECE